MPRNKRKIRERYFVIGISFSSYYNHARAIISNVILVAGLISLLKSLEIKIWLALEFVRINMVSMIQNDQEII